MTLFRIVLRGIARGKARFLCAAAGVAAATGAAFFIFALSAVNKAQAPSLALRASQPWQSWRVSGDGPWLRGAPAAKSSGPVGKRPDLALPLVNTTLDLRPGGKVLQGPPMRAIVSTAAHGNPFACTELEEGRWPDDGTNGAEIVCTRGTLKRFGRGEAPPVGSSVKFVGRASTMTATVVGYLKEARLPPAWPSVFANKAAMDALSSEKPGTLELWKKTPEDATVLLNANSETVVRAFEGDENRRMDYARPLLFAAATLTALALLVNSLLLSVEANKKTIALLRTIGLGRFGAVRMVALEALLATAAGWVLGCTTALCSLSLYVKADDAAFPAGMVSPCDFGGLFAATALSAVAVSLAAVLFALRPALGVHPLDALSESRKKPLRGMAAAFAFGFGAFVAVEVWGASLMRAFVPSPEWPDAIVSILPSGVDPCDRPKIDGLEGVARIGELYPLQLPLDPPEEMQTHAFGAPGGKPALRNVLFLGAEWLPHFKFCEGDWQRASDAVFSGHACVVSEMVARSHNLHKGDTLRVRSGGDRGSAARILELPIAGVVDVNWHMVTSRGLVRGLNGSPQKTDGAVFVSIETAGWLDPRPLLSFVNMTHLWVEYDKRFLEGNGVFPAGRKVEKAIEKALGNPSDSTVRLHARDEIADGTLAHGSQAIGQAARVPFVFLAILSIGFVAMLVADCDARRGELATLRAVGATRVQLAKFLSRDAAVTALCGMAAAVPSGALAGWLFSIKTGSIWPGLPHYFVFPARIIAEGGAGAMVFAMAIAIPCALRLVAAARLSGEGR